MRHAFQVLCAFTLWVIRVQLRSLNLWHTNSLRCTVIIHDALIRWPSSLGVKSVIAHLLMLLGDQGLTPTVSGCFLFRLLYVDIVARLGYYTKDDSWTALGIHITIWYFELFTIGWTWSTRHQLIIRLLELCTLQVWVETGVWTILLTDNDFVGRLCLIWQVDGRGSRVLWRWL